jgi:hypothetical protein
VASHLRMALRERRQCELLMRHLTLPAPMDFEGQCLTASLAYLSYWALCALQSGVVGNDLKPSRLPRAWGILHATPAAASALLDRVRSLTIQELESQSIISPPAFPAKVTPVKSALELTRARIPGP